LSAFPPPGSVSVQYSDSNVQFLLNRPVFPYKVLNPNVKYRYKL